MNRKTDTAARWYNRRQSALLLAVLALGLAYGMGSRAIDTGSLGQYAVACALLIFAANRISRGFRKGAAQ